MEQVKYLYWRKKRGEDKLDYNMLGHLTVDDGRTMLCGQALALEDWRIVDQAMIGYTLCSACKQKRANLSKRKLPKPHRPLAETISFDQDVKDFWLR